MRTRHRSRRGAIADKIWNAVFKAFGQDNLPEISTKSSAEEIKRWKDSKEVKTAYLKLNETKGLLGETFCSQILKKIWAKNPSDEQTTFTIAVIKYIFNTKIYLIKIKGGYIRSYMKKIKVNTFNLNYFIWILNI